MNLIVLDDKNRKTNFNKANTFGWFLSGNTVSKAFHDSLAVERFSKVTA